MINLGLKIGLETKAGSAGGGGGYIAKAVNFDGTQRLVNSALVATDSDVLFTSTWVKFSAPVSSADTIWVVDPENTYTNALLRGLIEGGSIELYADRVDPFGEMLIYEPNSSLVWMNILCKVNTTTGEHQVYINDVASTEDPNTDTGRPFTMQFNGLPLWFGDDGATDVLVADISDTWIAPNIDIDLSVEANRRLFIDAGGKPVDPAVAIASIGTPAVLFSGDANTFGTNQGTGGDFTLTGVLTNSTSSPSD